MTIHIEEFDSIYFRGLLDLTIDKLNKINIITGINNSGKTNLLEALLLLRNPCDFTNLLHVALMRDTNTYFTGVSLYESFINLFPGSSDEMTVVLDARCEGKRISYRLSGEQIKIMLDPEDAIKMRSCDKRNWVMSEMNSEFLEIDAFRGELISVIDGKENKAAVEIHTFSTPSGREINKNNLINMVYLSPNEHMRGFVFDHIIRDTEYKEECLRFLQQFDSEIIDFLVLKNPENGRTSEYIKHTSLGNMPLSTCGDGTKKLLALMNAIIKASGGVLLADEVASSIHSKQYDEIFRFLVKTSLQFDVQVFITTQSIEVIDSLLATQVYEQQKHSDDISVITLKKEGHDSKTISRVLSGRHAFENRQNFGFVARL